MYTHIDVYIYIHVYIYIYIKYMHMHRLYIDIYILGNIHWHACVRTYVHAYLHTQTYRHPKIYACVHPYAHMPNTYTHACIVCTGRCSLPRHIATMHCLQDLQCMQELVVCGWVLAAFKVCWTGSFSRFLVTLVLQKSE